MGSFKFLEHLIHIFSPKERWRFLGILGLLFIGAGLETVSVGIIPAFIALLGNPDLIQSQPATQTLYAWLKVKSANEFMLFLSLILLSIFLIKNLYLAFLSAYQYDFLRRKHIDFSSNLFKAYLLAPYTFHLQRNSAEISLTLTSEVHKLFWNVIVPFMTLISELTITTFLATLLVVMEPTSSLIAVGFLGTSLLIFSRIARRFTHDRGRIRQLSDSQIYKWVNQGVGGIKETKMLGREDFFVDAFLRYKTESEDAALVLELTRHYSQLFIETIIIAAVLLIAITTLVQGRSLQAVLPTLSLFAIASLRMMPSVKRIVATTASIRFYRHVLESISCDLNILNTSIKNSGFSYAKDLKSQKAFQDNIALRNIYFAYPGSQKLSISGISITIPRGNAVAFVGPSGAGKSTLVDIILGLLSPDEGEVLIDGSNINHDISSWQQQIGYIPQSIYLSDDTIRRNIAFGISDANIDDIRVWDVLKAAQLKDLVSSFPEQLNTWVGERGVRLSGGQRQRIGIARALYHNPEVLVMDEATAALDNDTEREFMEALEKLSGDKTLIIIAHRLNTVKNCDCIYYIENGTLCRQGTYEQLFGGDELIVSPSNPI